MSSLHVETKRKLKQTDMVSFKKLLNDLMLSDTENEIMLLLYKEHKSVNQIADRLGYSEIGIIKMHQRVLKKVAKLL